MLTKGKVLIWKPNIWDKCICDGMITSNRDAIIQFIHFISRKLRFYFAPT